MSSVPQTEVSVQQEVEQTEELMEETPITDNLQGLNTQFAVANKWVGYVPLANVLGKKYSNLELNLVRFTIPSMICGSTTVSFKGYQVEIPTKVMDPATKELTFEYIVDSNWLNYKSLFLFTAQTGIITKITDEVAEGISERPLIDVRVWLIDQFKHRIIDFVFHNCWIKIFHDLALDYTNPQEIHHSFTMAYSHYEIVNSN